MESHEILRRRIIGDGNFKAATLAEGSEKDQGGEKWEELGHEVMALWR